MAKWGLGIECHQPKLILPERNSLIVGFVSFPNYLCLISRGKRPSDITKDQSADRQFSILSKNHYSPKVFPKVAQQSFEIHLRETCL